MTALDGRAAVVTGASRGIGAAIARGLAEAGARVCVTARTMPRLEEVAASLREAGHHAVALHCDVSDPESVESMLRDAGEVLAGVDILVNNAGIAPSNPLHRLTLEEWDRTMAVNATGTFLCTRHAVGPMMERGWGRVVNIASVAGLQGSKYIAAYAASKHAVIGFTRCVALEMAGKGVTVNAVCPGYVDTPLTDVTLARIRTARGASEAEALAILLENAGQDRLVEDAEVADAVVRLCTDEAADTNGAVVVLSGRAGVAHSHSEHRGDP